MAERQSKCGQSASRTFVGSNFVGVLIPGSSDFLAVFDVAADPSSHFDQEQLQQLAHEVSGYDIAGGVAMRILELLLSDAQDALGVDRNDTFEAIRLKADIPRTAAHVTAICDAVVTVPLTETPVVFEDIGPTGAAGPAFLLTNLQLIGALIDVVVEGRGGELSRAEIVETYRGGLADLP